MKFVVGPDTVYSPLMSFEKESTKTQSYLYPCCGEGDIFHYNWSLNKIHVVPKPILANLLAYSLGMCSALFAINKEKWCENVKITNHIFSMPGFLDVGIFGKKPQSEE